MKTSNHISQFNNSTYRSIDIAWKIATAIIALAFAVSPLFLDSPGEYWYFPVVGTAVFLLALISGSTRETGMANMAESDVREDASEGLDLSQPIVTEFAKQKAANEKHNQQGAKVA